jgi:hypothetical protein
MRYIAHPAAHKNEIVGGERPLARVGFSINTSGRPAARPYDIAIFGTVMKKSPANGLY